MNNVRTILAMLVLLGAVGWVMNIVKFVQLDFEAPYKAEVIRGVSIPIGILGAVLGFVEVGDEKA